MSSHASSRRVPDTSTAQRSMWVKVFFWRVVSSAPEWKTKPKWKQISWTQRHPRIFLSCNRLHAKDCNCSLCVFFVCTYVCSVCLCARKAALCRWVMSGEHAVRTDGLNLQKGSEIPQCVGKSTQHASLAARWASRGFLKERSPCVRLNEWLYPDISLCPSSISAPAVENSHKN